MSNRGAIILGVGLGFLGLAWLYRRSAQALPAPAPGRTPATPIQGPTQTADQRRQTASDTRQSALQTRLRDPRALRIYLFQNLLWRYGHTTATPDGIAGPITQRLINDVNAILGTEPVPTNDAAFWDKYISRAQQAMLRRYGTTDQPMMFHDEFWLPESVRNSLLTTQNSALFTYGAGA